MRNLKGEIAKTVAWDKCMSLEVEEWVKEHIFGMESSWGAEKSDPGVRVVMIREMIGADCAA